MTQKLHTYVALALQFKDIPLGHEYSSSVTSSTASRPRPAPSSRTVRAAPREDSCSSTSCDTMVQGLRFRVPGFHLGNRFGVLGSWGQGRRNGHGLWNKSCCIQGSTRKRSCCHDFYFLTHEGRKELHKIGSQGAD